jgi:hypothetical protein
MKPSTVMLLGLLGIGLYLAYNSIMSSVRAVPSALVGAAGNAASTGLNTLLAEGAGLSSSLGNPVGLFSSLGTSAYNGISSLFGTGTSTTTTGGLSDLSGITSPSLLLPDGSNYSLPTDSFGSDALLPDDAGTLSFGSGGLSPSLGGGLTAVNSDGTYGDLSDSSSDFDTSGDFLEGL